MSSFWTGTVAAIVLAIAAAVILQSLGMDSGSVFSSPNVRL